MWLSATASGLIMVKVRLVAIIFFLGKNGVGGAKVAAGHRLFASARTLRRVLLVETQFVPTFVAPFCSAYIQSAFLAFVRLFT
jgi:hypothetical protein